MEHLFERLAEALQHATGYIYPNEAELHWNILIVVYPYVTGLVAGAAEAGKWRDLGSRSV